LKGRLLALALPVAAFAIGGAALATRGLTACNLGSDAGASTSDASAATGTVQDQCTKISTAFCERQQECAIPVTLSQCVSDEVAACCTGPSQCNAPAQTPDTYITACVDDVGGLDCNSVANNQLPTSCQGLPAKP
jgi:hypothetical protein